jgi:hypothetical protein
LEELELVSGEEMSTSDEELIILLQGLAAVPNLRTLKLQLETSETAESQEQGSEMFANAFAKALADSCNSSLETIYCPPNYSYRSVVQLSNPEVNSILPSTVRDLLIKNELKIIAVAKGVNNFWKQLLLRIPWTTITYTILAGAQSRWRFVLRQ